MLKCRARHWADLAVLAVPEYTEYISVEWAHSQAPSHLEPRRIWSKAWIIHVTRHQHQTTLQFPYCFGISSIYPTTTTIFPGNLSWEVLFVTHVRASKMSLVCHSIKPQRAGFVKMARPSQHSHQSQRLQQVLISQDGWMLILDISKLFLVLFSLSAYFFIDNT